MRFVLCLTYKPNSLVIQKLNKLMVDYDIQYSRISPRGHIESGHTLSFKDHFEFHWHTPMYGCEVELIQDVIKCLKEEGIIPYNLDDNDTTTGRIIEW